MTKKQKGAEANEEKGFTKATVSVKRKEKRLEHGAIPVTSNVQKEIKTVVATVGQRSIYKNTYFA